MFGEFRNIIFDTGVSHIRSIRCDETYLKSYYYNLHKGMISRKRMKMMCTNVKLMREDPSINMCPLCNLGEKGNQRHLHTVCTHPHLVKVRNYLYDIMEGAIQKLFTTSDEISRLLGLKSENNLYPLLLNALKTAELQRPSVQSNQARYRDSNIQINDLRTWRDSIQDITNYADLNIQDNSDNLASTHEIIQLPNQHPFSLTLGLTGRILQTPWSSDVFKLSTNKANNVTVTSPVDKMYVGLLPLAMNDAVNSFLKLTHQPHLNDLRRDLTCQWNDIQKIIQCKPIILQRNIRGILNNKAKEWKSNFDTVISTKQTKRHIIPPVRLLQPACSATLKETNESSMTHSCQGTLYQVRLLRNIGIKNLVKSKGAICYKCKEE